MPWLETLFGKRIDQDLLDLSFWELALNDFPNTTGIVELGTAEGGFSWFLFAQTLARRMKWGFTTFDLVLPVEPPPGFVLGDYWNHALVIQRLADGCSILCDGGDKVREVRTFGEHLSPDAFLAVHDIGREFTFADIPEHLEVSRIGEKTLFLKRK